MTIIAGPDDWARVRPLLERLVCLPGREQDAALLEVADEDPALAARVADLLRRDRTDSDFLRPPQPSPMGAPLAAGDVLGAWRLLRPLGSGGMGEVWLGERADGSFEKRVAIKLLKGALVSELQRQRFAGERDLLAGLEHPSIARLLDGGSGADGRPWLVMEYVDGLPIDQAADEAQLGVAQRLELFCGVCEAVAAAHAALVVHRDIKPDNVLVTSDGRPVLLDFGVAKVLATGEQADDPLTVTGERAFTPSYASPEQLLGRALTTATDVYSLGVLLYELLAGRRPHDLTGASATEIVRRLTEVAPPAPSRVAPQPRQRALRGDLDTIVAKAMHVEPARRYPSARALADDVQRHLDGLPVHARPDELGYRLGRFVVRHAVAVAGVAAVTLVLVGSLIIITALLWQTEQARGEAEAGRQAAATRAESLASLAHGLVFDVYDAVEHLPGASAARTSLLDLAMGALDDLAGRGLASPETQLELGQAWLRLGDLQGRPGAASGLDLERAATSYRRVIELLDGLPEPREAGAGVLRADALGKLAAVELRAGRRQQAAAALDDAGAELRRGDDPVAQAGLALRQAEYWQTSGRSDEALAACARAGELLAGLDRMDLGVMRQAQLLAWRRGQIQRARRDLVGAESSLNRALLLAEAVSVAFPDDGQAARDLGLALGEQGSLLIDLGQLDQAADPMQRQLELFERLHAAGPDEVVAQVDLALAYEKRAEWSVARGEWQAALQDRRRALALDSGLASRGVGGPVALSRWGHDELLVSDAELALGRGADALASALRAIEILTPLHAADGADAPRARDLLVAELRVGEVRLAEQDFERALSAFERGQQLAGALVQLDPQHGATRRLQMVAGYFRAVCHQALGRQDQLALAERVVHMARAAELFVETQRLTAQLAQAGMLQPGDADMEPVLETEARACERERAALMRSRDP